MEPPSTPFALQTSFPPVIFTYCRKTDGGRGEQRMWQIANFLKKHGIASFNGMQTEPGKDWMMNWFGKMPEVDVCIAMIGPEYFTSGPCKEEIYATAREGIPILPIIFETLPLKRGYFGTSDDEHERGNFVAMKLGNPQENPFGRQRSYGNPSHWLPAPDEGLFQDNWEANLAKLLVQVKKYVSADSIGPPEHDVAGYERQGTSAAPAAPTATAPAASSIEGLRELMQECKLDDKLAVANAWCEKEGAESVADIVENEFVAQFVAALEPLPGISKKKLLKKLEGGGGGGVNFNLALPAGKLHHIFISYYSKEMDGVFASLMNTLKALGFNVFNQKIDLAGHDVSLELMQEHAAGSVLVLALLSPNYFTSKYCRGELEGAAAAGVPINPVYSGEHNPAQTIKDLMTLRGDAEKGAAVTAAFDENLIDVNNGEHADAVMMNLKEKILGRYFAK